MFFLPWKQVIFTNNNKPLVYQDFLPISSNTVPKGIILTLPWWKDPTFISRFERNLRVGIQLGRKTWPSRRKIKLGVQITPPRNFRRRKDNIVMYRSIDIDDNNKYFTEENLKRFMTSYTISSRYYSDWLDRCLFHRDAKPQKPIVFGVVFSRLYLGPNAVFLIMIPIGVYLDQAIFQLMVKI